jgi:hypothetical protein
MTTKPKLYYFVLRRVYWDTQPTYCGLRGCDTVRWVDRVLNVMAHAQKPDFVFRRNGRVPLNRRGRQFSGLLAGELCASACKVLYCIHLHGQSKTGYYSGYLVSGPWAPGLKEKVPVPILGRYDRYRRNVTYGPVQMFRRSYKNCTSFPCFVIRPVLTKHVSQTLFCGSTGVGYDCVEHTYFFSSVIRQISEEMVFGCLPVRA